jgi:hypothetical protein
VEVAAPRRDRRVRRRPIAFTGGNPASGGSIWITFIPVAYFYVKRSDNE